MKKILLINNTLGLAGAEVALLAMIKSLKSAIPDARIDLYVMMAQGELIKSLPDYVNVLNSSFCEVPIHEKKGASHLLTYSFRSVIRAGHIFKQLAYIKKGVDSIKASGNPIAKDKLLWKSISDGAMLINEEYDLAIAYLEGGSTYYLADHVKAKHKASFVHISYDKAGYTKELDHGVYDKIDRIYCVSDEVKQAFDAFYPEYKNKTKVFHNIIDKDRIIDMSLQSNPIWPGDNNSIKLLSVGRLHQQKAFDISIDVMAILKDKGIDASFYIVGDGDIRDELNELAVKKGVSDRFFILGRKDNPYIYTKNCDIYLQTSRFEGKSIALQEAQILGRAVIASDCDGNREQVVDGIDGRLVKLDASIIAQAIIDLINSPKLITEYGQKASLRKFNYDNELQDLIKLIED